MTLCRQPGRRGGCFLPSGSSYLEGHLSEGSNLYSPVPKGLDFHARAELQPSQARKAKAACRKHRLPIPLGWFLRAAGLVANVKRMVKTYRNHKARGSGKMPHPGRTTLVPSVFLFPREKSPPLPPRCRHVQQKGCSPGVVEAPASTLQTQSGAKHARMARCSMSFYFLAAGCVH